MTVCCWQFPFSPRASVSPICNKAVVLDNPSGPLWEVTWLVRMLQSLAAPCSVAS